MQLKNWCPLALKKEPVGFSETSVFISRLIGSHIKTAVWWCSLSRWTFLT